MEVSEEEKMYSEQPAGTAPDPPSVSNPSPVPYECRNRGPSCSIRR